MSMLAYGDVSEIVNRLNDQMTLLETPAQLAWSTNPLDELEFDVPTVMVYPGQQFSSQSGDSPSCRQLTSISVILLIVTPIDSIGPVVKEVHDAILGYQIAPEYGILKYTHRNYPYGVPLEIKGKFIWWQMTVEADFLHRTV
ncbi:MAG: hypothetical protein DRI24_23865 [Deltaproteobacteria bacterium]|nr:MAG: hypothetical protein DRI24_23865 [Deltaproteobacteria bacterium]